MRRWRWGRVPMRRFGAALLLPFAVAAAFYAFRPRPDLYGGTPFSSRLFDHRHRDHAVAAEPCRR
ncbi:MAG: hypothetical protein U5K38_09375 [Woeseiaceae bacterium]|nr:hypothetical protein [Woeseiaceae bacterium]